MIASRSPTLCGTGPSNERIFAQHDEFGLRMVGDQFVERGNDIGLSGKFSWMPAIGTRADFSFCSVQSSKTREQMTQHQEPPAQKYESST